MKNSSKIYFSAENSGWEDLGAGVSRQILGYDDNIMMVKVKFEKGAIGAVHQHIHSQTTYCESGKFEFTIDGEKQVINPGDGLYIKPNIIHGALCIESGILIDVFSPIREDFLTNPGAAYNTK